MRRKLEPAYIRGFLIDALLSAMPLREATVFVDRILPSICLELDSSENEGDDYEIKAAFAKVVMKNISSMG